MQQNFEQNGPKYSLKDLLMQGLSESHALDAVLKNVIFVSVDDQPEIRRVSIRRWKQERFNTIKIFAIVHQLGGDVKDFKGMLYFHTFTRAFDVELRSEGFSEGTGQFGVVTLQEFENKDKDKMTLYGSPGTNLLIATFTPNFVKEGFSHKDLDIIRSWIKSKGLKVDREVNVVQHSSHYGAAVSTESIAFVIDDEKN